MPFPLVSIVRDLPIRHKVLLGGLLPLLLILCAGGLLATRRLEASLTDHLEAELRTTTSLITGMVQASAETSIRNHLRSLAEAHRSLARHFHERVQRGELPEAEAKRQCAELMLTQRVGQTGYLYVLDPQGVVRVHPNPAMIGRSVAEHGFVKAQMAMREGYLEYNWRNPGEALDRAKALYMLPFEPWGWIISASSYRSEFASLVDVADFRNRILSLRLGPAGYPFVMDAQGRLLIHPLMQGRSLETESDAYSQHFLTEVRRQRSGDLTYLWHGPTDPKPRLKRCVFLEIPELGWVVGTTFYLDEAYGPLQRMRLAMLLLLGVALVVAIPVTLWVSTRITRPLSALALAFRRGAEAADPVPVHGADEVGRLSEGFNGFLAALRRSEAALRDSELRYRGIFENVAEGLVQSTPEGRLLHVNPAMARLFGCATPEELLAWAGEDVTRIYADPPSRADLVERIRLGEAGVLECQMQRRDGTRFWARIKAIGRRDADGVMRAIDSLVEDASEWHRRQEELEVLVAQRTRELKEAKDLAERATRAKSEFLSSMSHELRTPLNAILLYADLLAEEAEDGDPERFREDLGRIRHSGQHLLGLVNNILDLAKIEAGHLVLTPEPMDAASLLEEVAATLAPLAGRRGLSLEVKPPASRVQVLADPMRVRQILLNLGGNAVKFTESGTITLACEPLGDRARFSVADTGIGLSQEEMARIFEPFEQTDEGRKRPGTGLGLAISRQLAHLMDGDLEVVSALGEGSTFHLELPLLRG